MTETLRAIPRRRRTGPHTPPKKVFVPLFSSGFETGDLTEWDGYTDSYPDTRIPTVVSDQKHHGEYSCYFRKVVPYDSPIYKNLAGYTELYFAGQIRFTQISSVEPLQLVLFCLGMWGDEQLGMGVIRSLAEFGDSDPRFFGYYTDGLGYRNYSYTTIKPSLDTWYFLQLGGRQHATEGFLKVWINQSLEVELLNIDASGFDFSRHQTGIMMLTSIADTDNILHGDCYALNDTYIPTDPFA